MSHTVIASAFAAAMRLRWIGCGRQDAGYARAKEAHQALAAAQVAHRWFETAGGHDRPVWRASLHDLLPQLFHPR